TPSSSSSSPFVGLEVVTMTDGNVCMIEGRFPCTIELAEGDGGDQNHQQKKSFTVNIKTLQSTLLNSFDIVWYMEDTAILCELITQGDNRSIASASGASSSSSGAAASAHLRIRGAEIRVPLLQTE